MRSGELSHSDFEDIGSGPQIKLVLYQKWLFIKALLNSKSYYWDSDSLVPTNMRSTCIYFCQMSFPPMLPPKPHQDLSTLSLLFQFLPLKLLEEKKVMEHYEQKGAIWTGLVV